MHAANSSRGRAFTLVEMLVSIAIMMILATLVVSALSHAKEKARRTICLNNVRQLAFSMEMYLGDNKDVFPSAGSYGAMVDEDWLRWQPVVTSGLTTSPDQRLNLQRSGIVPYIMKFSTNLFTCPSDQILPKFRERPKTFSAKYMHLQFYPYSYTLNRHDNVGKDIGLGMASYARFIPDFGTVFEKFFRSEIVAPSSKIMFVDEEMMYETGLDLNIRPSGSTAVSSAWEWPYDNITRRHSKMGVVGFADGHVAVVRPEIGKMETHYNPKK